MWRCATTAVMLLSTLLSAGFVAAREQIIGGPCEGCENVFVGLPEQLTSETRIAPPDEPGEQLVLEGTVRGLDGEPAAGVIVYAYHTDAQGIYPRADTRHGRLRAWVKTDESGHYRFETIRPGAYPGRTVPEHIHMHVIEPGRVSYYIASVHFDDDPLLTPAEKRRAETGRGGSALVRPERGADGVWHVRRDVVLGLEIPDYPCPRRWTFPVPFHQSLSWSPDGRSLAVSAVLSSWEAGYGMFVVRRDGSERHVLDPGTDAALYPAWSPDGKRLAFAAKQADNTDIYVMQADGAEVRRLTTHEANDNHPTWSPDGTRLAFHSNRHGNTEIYVMRADGSDVQRLTDHPADDYNPSWSPDGRLIAFDSNRDDVPGDEIYVMSPEGQGIRRVVDSGVFPAWSPDSERILYADQGLFTVNVDGSDRRQLLEHAVAATWSPDGSTIAAARIVYDDQCHDRHVLVLLPAAGGDARPLLRD